MQSVIRIRRIGFTAGFLFTIGASSAGVAQVCDETSELNAVHILGSDAGGVLTDQVYPLVAGDRNFLQPLANGWVFALMKVEAGWTLRLYEHDRIGDAVDLTSMTPPYGAAPNPRDLFGWHFATRTIPAATPGM
jgi:hypothetical protein